MSSNGSMAYRPDVDGLRAVAVTSVVAYHAAPSLVPGGYVGVDVFFVISGFLISSIIVRERDEGRFSLAGFYARRIKRLFPALMVVLAATWVAGWYFLLPHEFRLLEYMMQRSDQLLTRAMLLEEVWNYKFVPATNLVDVHMGRLRHKVDGPNEAPMIHNVRGAGFILRPTA